MKKIVTGDLDILEKEYLENYNSWIIEESILSSFKRRELKSFIEELNKDYLLFKLPYIKKLGELQKKGNTKLEKFFIEKMQYYFDGGKELEDHKEKVIKRFENFYKTQYSKSSKNGYHRDFDINTVPIVEILSLYMRVPSNLRYHVLCPLHKEKSGSFKIYQNSNSWYCFGCQKGGNAINFVAEIENISNKEAFIKIANLYTNTDTNG